MKKFKFKSSKEKQKIKFLSDCSNMLIGTHIEMFSNKEINIEGCEKILEYTDDHIKLKLSKGMLLLFGEEFDIETFEGSIIVIKGNISSIEFCV